MTDRALLLLILGVTLLNSVGTWLNLHIIKSLLEHSLLVGELLLKISKLVVPGGFGV